MLHNGLYAAHCLEIFKWPLWNKRLLYTDVKPYIQFLINSGVPVDDVSPLTKSHTWKNSRLNGSPVCWHTRSGPNIWNIQKMVSTNHNCWRVPSSLPFILIMQTQEWVFSLMKAQGTKTRNIPNAESLRWHLFLQYSIRWISCRGLHAFLEKCVQKLQRIMNWHEKERWLENWQHTTHYT